MMLHTKYQGSRPCGFRLEDCSCFLYIDLVKNVTSGMGQFWPQGHNFNKLCRGALDDATYQISCSRPCGL